MRKHIGYIILSLMLAIITGFIIYIIVTKQDVSTNEFNLKRGDVLTFEEYKTKVKILNVASTLCKKEKCDLLGEVEVSVEVTYDEEISTYTLKSKSNSTERIKKSNNFITLKYEDGKLKIEVKDKKEI